MVFSAFLITSVCEINGTLSVWSCFWNPPPPPKFQCCRGRWREGLTGNAVYFASARAPHLPTATLTLGGAGGNPSQTALAECRLFRKHRSQVSLPSLQYLMLQCFTTEIRRRVTLQSQQLLQPRRMEITCPCWNPVDACVRHVAREQMGTLQNSPQKRKLVFARG